VYEVGLRLHRVIHASPALGDLSRLSLGCVRAKRAASQRGGRSARGPPGPSGPIGPPGPASGANGPTIDENEADETTIIGNIINGEYSHPVRVVAFNTHEGWSRNVTEEIAFKLFDLSSEGRVLGSIAW
jgi:hypothetical protein